MPGHWEWMEPGQGSWVRLDTPTNTIFENELKTGVASLNYKKFREMGGCKVNFFDMILVPGDPQRPPIPIRRIPPPPFGFVPAPAPVPLMGGGGGGDQRQHHQTPPNPTPGGMNEPSFEAPPPYEQVVFGKMPFSFLFLVLV